MLIVSHIVLILDDSSEKVTLKFILNDAVDVNKRLSQIEILSSLHSAHRVQSYYLFQGHSPL